MGGPYLESGESIVLTTDRVSIDAVMYQAMLTTRRLILIDSRNTRFEPGIIFLSAIQTVRSGKAATGDPVIILTLQDEGHAGEETRIIIFSQEPAENRKTDRDLWVKTFIELSLSGREAKSEQEIPAAAEHGGMRPTIRRWVAPDIVRPRTDNFPVKEPAPEITFSPEEPVSIAKEVPTPADAPNIAEDRRDEEAGQGYKDSLVHATRTVVQSLAEPEPESPLPVPLPVHPEHEKPEPPAITVPPAGPAFTGPDPSSSLSVSIVAAVKSLTAGKPQDPSDIHQPVTGNSAPDEFPEIPYERPVRFTSRLPDNLETLPVSVTTAIHVSPSSAEEAGSGSTLPAYEVIATGVRSTSLLPEIPLGIPEPPLSAPEINPATPEPDPQPITGESASWNPPLGPDEDTGRQWDSPETPAAPKTPPDTPPERPGSGRYPILIFGGILLCILLVIAGVLLLPGILPQDSGKVAIIPPVMTPAAEQTPPASTGSPPTNGTWVRIDSPGYFTGRVGNPDSLQQVSGSGEKWFKVRDSRGLVKVSAEKQEYTGDALRVEVYSDGRVITSRVTSAPQGTVDLLIDPATGEAPGMTETPNPTGTGNGGLEYL